MHIRQFLSGALLGAVALDAHALRAQSDDARRAMASIVGLDLTSADIVEWCASRAPDAAAPLRAAWQTWRSANAVDQITGRLDAELLRRTREGMGQVTAATRLKLSKAGLPATVCPQLSSMWTSTEFDARRTYAAAYTHLSEVPDSAPGTAAPARQPAASGAAPAATAPRAQGQFNTQYYASTTRPTGSVYSVAQMTALRQQWVGTPYNYDRGLQSMRAAGTLYIAGKVMKRGARFFLETNDGAFSSSLSVAPDIGLSAFEGQEITLQGDLDELPNSMVFLRNTRVVRDPSGLRASTVSAAPGLRRKTVSPAEITAANGRGVQPQDLVGMHYVAYGTTGVSGYEFREELRLLFRDGWAYLRFDVPPADLDVAASRRLEPQQWAHWRRDGSEYAFQRQDDNGKSSGDWSRKPGRMIPAWKAAQRLSGSYSAAAFNGSIAFGGTYSSTSVSFTPDGRWERVGYSQTSSASVAAQEPVGYSGSASSVSDGSGTRSSAGGGNASVYAGSQSRRDDGAKNRGTYRFDGMTIELRSDDGKVTRALCLPMDGELKSIFLFGRSFSRK